MKKILTALFTISFLFFFKPDVWAADITVEFRNDAENTISGGALFNEVNWLPGHTVEKSFEVINSDPAADCLLRIYTINEIETTRELLPIPTFAQRLFTAIELEGDGIVYGNFANPVEAAGPESLQNIYDMPFLAMDVLPSGGGSNVYNWVVTFDRTAENEYQEATNTFDLVLVCEEYTEGEDDGPQDKTQRDKRPKMDHGGGGNDEGSGGAVAGVTTSVFLPFITSTSTEPEKEPEKFVGTEPAEIVKTPTVGGAATCVDPWWWWLVFLLQTLLQFIVLDWIKEKHLDKRTRFYFMQLLFLAAFFYIFWKYFCPWWDKWLSLLISLFNLYLTRRRFKKLKGKAT